MTMTASFSILISKHATASKYKKESIKQANLTQELGVGVAVIKKKNALHISPNSIYHLHISSDSIYHLRIRSDQREHLLESNRRIVVSQLPAVQS